MFLQSHRFPKLLAAKLALVFLLSVHEALVPRQCPRMRIVLVANVADMRQAYLAVKLHMHRQTSLSQQPLLTKGALVFRFVAQLQMHPFDVLLEAASSAWS